MILKQWTKDHVEKRGKCRDIVRFEEMVLQKEKVDENKILKEIIGKKYMILIEGEEQQDLIKASWDHDLGEEISTEVWNYI